MQAVLSEMISLLVGGITGIASGIGSGLEALVKNVFVTGAGTSSDPYQLTIFAGAVMCFAGISLAVALSRKIVNWVSTIGARN